MFARIQVSWRRVAAALGFLTLSFLMLFTAQAQDPVKKKASKDVDPGFDVYANSQGVEQIKLIDEELAKGWKDNNITPSERASDYEFIRRASLDIIGRIAKVHEIEQFMKDSPRERRSKLVERLLASDEYAQNWAGIWTVHLLTRSGSGKYHQEQFHDWLTEKLKEKKEGSDKYVPDWSKIVTELLTATGRTEENSAVNFILHHMGDPVTKDRENNGAFDMVPLTSRTTRLFLGLRTQCVQCHDHPFNGEWGQHHFWGINAFFRQTDAPQGRPTGMTGKKKKKNKEEGRQEFTLLDNAELNKKGLVFYERRNTLLLPTDAKFLDGQKMTLKSDSTRRKELAKFIVNSPFFAKVNVNRTWAHFFGKSLTKDNPDDFGEHNPVSHPELLKKLAEDWATKYAHNPKDLIRWICNSRAYGLSGVANKTNDQPETEIFFSRMLLKSMSPEQLFESLMVATQAKVGESKEAKTELRQEWLDKLVVNFGDDEGNEASYNGTVIQALLLMNGQDINSAIMDEKTGTVAAILKKRAFSPTGAKDAVRDIYLATLNRPPSAAEFARIVNPKTYMFRPEVQKNQKNQAAFWTGYYQDIMWAVVNSNEFFLNH